MSDFIFNFYGKRNSNNADFYFYLIETFKFIISIIQELLLLLLFIVSLEI